MLAPDRVALERGQLLQAQLEDRLGLDVGQPEARHQLRARDVAVARAADQGDHLVEVIERDQLTLEDVLARLQLAQLELRAAHDHLALMLDVVVDDRAQRKRARHVVHERHRVDAERRLHRGVLVELVQHHLRDHAALELDHDPHALAVRLVPQVGDLGDLLLAHEVGDLADQAAVAALLDHEGQLGDDDRLLALIERLGVGPRPHAHPATTGLVGLADPGDTEDHAAGGKVRALHVLHQAGDGDVGIVDVGDRRVDRFAQVVRRDVGGHAHGDAGCAVDQEVRKARRQDERLLLAPVVVRLEVDRVGVEVAQHLARQGRQPRFGVPHRGSRIVVDRAEVALAVDQRVAHGEVLRQPHERVVDRRVAVRVVVAHHVADDAGALGVRPVGLQAVLVHREQHAAVDGLEPVAGVGQRPAHDHRHRVVEVGGAHLLLEPARLDVPAADQIRGGHRESPPP